MKRALLLILAACPGPRDSTPADAPLDASAPLDAPVWQAPDRTVNNVIVGPTYTYWSHGEFKACSLEAGCPSGPTVTQFSVATERVVTWVDGGVGTWQIAGTEDELFYVNGEDDAHMYLSRITPTSVTPLSIPGPRLMGPAVDETYVYWAESNAQGSSFLLRRAARSGDGLDVTTLATTMWGTERLTYSNGDLWWIELGGEGWLSRVPASGGTPERIVDRVTALAATTDGVLVGRALVHGAELGRVDSTGTYQLIASQPVDTAVPAYIVPDGELIFWSAADGNLYFASSTGGSIGSITAANDRPGHTFAVLPDRYLVDFSRTGFRSIPR